MDIEQRESSSTGYLQGESVNSRWWQEYEFWLTAGRAAGGACVWRGWGDRGAGQPPSVMLLLPLLWLCVEKNTAGFTDRVLLKG